MFLMFCFRTKKSTEQIRNSWYRTMRLRFLLFRLFIHCLCPVFFLLRLSPFFCFRFIQETVKPCSGRHRSNGRNLLVKGISQNYSLRILMIQPREKIFPQLFDLAGKRFLQGRKETEPYALPGGIQVYFLRLQIQAPGIQQIIGHTFHNLLKRAKQKLKERSARQMGFQIDRKRLSGCDVIIIQGSAIHLLDSAFQETGDIVQLHHAYLVMHSVQLPSSGQNQVIMMKIPAEFRLYFLHTSAPCQGRGLPESVGGSGPDSFS